MNPFRQDCKDEIADLAFAILRDNKVDPEDYLDYVVRNPHSEYSAIVVWAAGIVQKWQYERAHQKVGE